MWPNGGQNGHDGLNYSVFFFFDEEKNLRKTQKNYKIKKIPKNNTKISFEIVSAILFVYCGHITVIFLCASRHIHVKKIYYSVL